ncbi:hypothetical protein SB48_HM08orf00472 [Heyndrickxia coagulans]|uniref:Uncharacterized protein n=1 Tax=Heyndrickxia coagulans TaxID=1398 RepID=A0AAN0WAA6_HEYCO|nr:hypothetical protein SB48_HM08orf00472 [Heyndrickxia coagulans]
MCKTFKIFSGQAVGIVDKSVDNCGFCGKTFWKARNQYTACA